MLIGLQEASTPGSNPITRSEVAAASRPKKGIISGLKQKENESTGKLYKPSKHDAKEMKHINWKTPTFWPIISQVVDKHNRGVGRPSLSAIVQDLQGRDKRFNFLSHQRLSDWRDKTHQDKIIWSEKTLSEVKKEFLPGGNQTHFDVFVSIYSLSIRRLTNTIIA